MRSSIAESIMETVSDLNKSGIVDSVTMKNIGRLCNPNTHDSTPENIVPIR